MSKKNPLGAFGAPAKECRNRDSVRTYGSKKCGSTRGWSLDKPVLGQGGGGVQPPYTEQRKFSDLHEMPKNGPNVRKLTVTWFLPYIQHYTGAAGAKKILAISGFLPSRPRLFFSKKKK
jgi:hypothetical protein